MKVGLLLAAGRSSRFGTGNKLLASLRGQPLIRHAARAMLDVDLDLRLAVVADRRVEALLPGYFCLRIENLTASQSDSLKYGVRRAIDLKATRLLIALGDMPEVAAPLLSEVLGRCRDDLAATAVLHDCPSPPACFPGRDLPRLLGLSGDRGAGEMLKNLPREARVTAPATALRDVDTPDDLRNLNEEGGS